MQRRAVREIVPQPCRTLPAGSLLLSFAAHRTARGGDELAMRLAIFDLDNTLLAGDSDHLWGEYLIEHGLVDAAQYRAGNDRFYADYEAGRLDIHAFAAFSFEPLVRLPRERLLALRERFVADRIAPLVAPAAPALLAAHRDAGELLVLTTATNRFVTEPIAELLGVDALIATDPEQRDGRYTGRIAGIPNFRDGKVRRLEAFLAERGIEADHTVAYSDSRNDLPLLQAADEAVAVDPDPVLAEQAQARGWRILSLRRGREPMDITEASTT